MFADTYQPVTRETAPKPAKPPSDSAADVWFAQYAPALLDRAPPAK